jgi:RNA polymerase-associated protein CTR9
MPKSQSNFQGGIIVIVLNIFPRLFASLANDKSHGLPYNRDIADQRRKYGDIMLRKADEHLVAQRKYEAEQLARIEAGRRKREDEKRRQEEEEVR